MHPLIVASLANLDQSTAAILDGLKTSYRDDRENFARHLVCAIAQLQVIMDSGEEHETDMLKSIFALGVARFADKLTEWFEEDHNG